MWFDVEPCDLGFVEQSRHSLDYEVLLPATPERAFDALSGDEMRLWFEDFVACRWTSPPPHGVGSTREIELKIVTVKERFLVWEPGKRLTFTIYASTLPITRQMVEDMQLEPAGDRATRLRWRVHYTPSKIARPIHPIARFAFGRMFQRSVDNLSRYLAGAPAPQPAR